MINSNSHYANQTFNSIALNQSQLEAIEFYECKFVDCSIAEAIFHQCKFIDSTFKNCDLSLLQIPECIFSGVTFEVTKLIGIDWTKANWSATLLQEPPTFVLCVLNHSTFIGLDIKGSQIKDCIASDVDFREADLTQVDFGGTDLNESIFSKTNLTKADLSRARNYIISPEENLLKGAKFSLPEAMSLLYSLDINLIGLDE